MAVKRHISDDVPVRCVLEHAVSDSLEVGASRKRVVGISLIEDTASGQRLLPRGTMRNTGQNAQSLPSCCICESQMR